MKTRYKVAISIIALALTAHFFKICTYSAYYAGKLDGAKENGDYVIQVNKQAAKERQEGIKSDWIKILTPDGRAYYKTDLAAPTLFVEQMDYVSFDKGTYAFKPQDFDIFEIFYIVHNHPDDGIKFEVPAQEDPEDSIPEGKYGGKFRLL